MLDNYLRMLYYSLMPDATTGTGGIGDRDMKKITHGDQQAKMEIGDIVVSSDVDGKLYMNELRGGFGCAYGRGVKNQFWGVALLPIDRAEALSEENAMIDYNNAWDEIEAGFLEAQRADVEGDFAPWSTHEQYMELQDDNAENYI